MCRINKRTLPVPPPAELGATGEMIHVLLEMVTPLPPASEPLTSIHGCVLAESVLVRSDIPPHPVSTRDGYALNSASLTGLLGRNGSVELPVFGFSSPGDPTPEELPGKSAARILTGAPLPLGADTVVLQEACEIVQSDGDTVRRVAIPLPLPVERHVAAKGCEFPKGKIALGSGTLLDPLAAATLSVLGLQTALVHPRPRVGIIVTGSELSETGVTPASNAPLVAGMVRAVGCEVASLAVVADDLTELEYAFERGLDSDIILTTGGTGPGPRDIVGLAAQRYIERSLWNDRREGSRARRFRILRDQAKVRRIPHLGLPGRPVAAVVSFCLFAYPLLRRLAGHPDVYPRICLAQLRSRADVDLKRFQPVKLQRCGDVTVASPVPVAASEGLDAALHSDGFALLSRRESGADRESRVPILLLPWRQTAYHERSAG